ncbi:restriction endonuclease subunit S [Nitrosomonas sp.]|uniref:restriction endonuclease subunit S n=1 Tax=Nitrosomonas sp. TaxID=42353 RepID=UPI0025FE88DD|nr:restriction endonuclease subunit S [Nitrosomonas sp.]MBY0483243.1 restriction endonuclease subunit S [Nitrosomonas sp.]
MSEWREYVLEDVIDKFIDYRGKTPTKTASGIPLVTAKIVKAGKILPPNEFIAQEDYDSWMTRGLPEIDDLVLTTEAPLGEVALIKDKNVALAQRIITLRGKKEFVFNPFLKYYFQNDTGQHELQSRASGTTVFGIKASVLRNMSVELPDIEEQKAIASVLSSLDDKIDLLHRQNKTLEAMAETLFRQWFVEEGSDFREGHLADVAINVKEAIKASDLKSESKYIGLEHIDQRNIALKQYGFGSEVSSNKYAFQKHDILFGKLRPYFHKVCFAPFSGICSTDILVIRPIKSELFAFCLFAFFQDEVVEYANSSSGGTRMPRTDWATLKNYPIAIPDSDSIERFNNVVSSSLKKISSNLEQIKTHETLRNTLLPKLMSGEARVAV